MKNKILSRLVCTFIALSAIACSSQTHVTSVSEPLLDGILTSVQVDWTFDVPGLLRADIDGHDQCLIKCDADGIVLLDPNMSQQVALSFDKDPALWVRTTTHGWQTLHPDVADSSNITSQAHLLETGGAPAWSEHGLGLTAPLFLRALEIIQDHRSNATASGGVSGHRQAYAGIILQHIGPSRIAFAIDAGGAHFGRDCASMSDQRSIDCCLDKPGLLAQGCLLECDMYA